MHTPSIRELDPERDAADIVEILREASPLIVLSRDSWLHRVRTIPERAKQAGWVVEDEGRVVANGWVFRTFFSEGSTSAQCAVNVRAAHRRRGIGSALYERVLEHVEALGSTSLLASFPEDDAGVSFAKARGFREERAEAESVLDPRTVAERPASDLDLRRVADVEPRLVYDADIAATRDMPSTEPVDEIPYDEWVGHVLEYPFFTAEGSYVAMVDGVAAAVSLLIADEESGRGANMFTGTQSAYRGRGLGLAVKLASIAWAREHGITQIATRNDETNAPMLAINRRLGYVPAGRRVEYIREL
ncbi:MAG TPA: GNAT family N-acetyltransferase [Gaiellaceae bacterium]|nr:GNAT family N-acetyltransferase [Gaiellaceae bacterium]